MKTYDHVTTMLGVLPGLGRGSWNLEALKIVDDRN